MFHWYCPIMQTGSLSRFMSPGNRVALQRYAAATVIALVLVACGGTTGDSSGSGDDESAGPATTVLSDDELAILGGSVALCNDGNYSDNADFDATCSGGDGIDYWLGSYGECENDRIILMAEGSDCDGNGGFRTVLSADFIPTAQPDDVALCNDGLYSNNTDFGATCSGGDGVDRWLANFIECVDGSVVGLSSNANCDSGFERLLPMDYQPAAEQGDVAECKNGSFSDNTDFDATCSANGGVARWLADYVECEDGQIVLLDVDAVCDAGFKRLVPGGYVPPTTTTAPTATSSTVPDSLLALDVLAVITVENEQSDGYDRDLFSYGDVTDDRGCRTRPSVLIRDSRTPAQVDPVGCAVIAGDWYSVYDGLTWTDPAELEIDHVVALKEAWDSGAWGWEAERRSAFGNDLEDVRSLRAVTGSVNQSKSDADPSNWLPPDDAFVCTYLADWVSIKARWGLSMDESEFGRISNLLTDRCPDQAIAPWPETAPAPPPTATPPTTSPPPPVQEPPAAPGNVFYQNCDAVRAAGADPIRAGDPGWDTKFDGDGDGVGCE